MAANDLLLLHGTIYGVLPPDIAWIGLADISATVAAGIAPQPEADDYPYMASPAGWFKGSMTDTSPIDFVHWSGAGTIVLDGNLSWWEQCMTLFMRHI